ncbi:MAG: hypothetical protein AAF414_09675 [Pseudomonadota bacterium]
MTDVQDRNIGSLCKNPLRILMYGLLVAAGVALAACGGRGDDVEQEIIFESPPPPPTGCPNVSVLAGTETVTQFAGGATGSSAAVIARGLIGDFVGECTYSENAVAVALDLPIIGSAGPASTGGAAYEYFVAVLSPTNRLLGKEIFVATIGFDASGSGTVVEILEQIIPLPDGAASGSRYSILVGFQLTPQQLRYNRAL